MPCPDPGGAGRREGRGPRTGTGPPRRRRHGALGTWPAVGLTLAVLAAANVAAHLGPAAAAVRTAAALAVSALLLGVLRWAGGTWADAGLARCTMARGARWALALVGIVAAVYLVAALLPAGRALFEDRRYAGMDGGELALRILVLVPVGTVLVEETAFRGVLYGLVRRARGTVWATAVSSLLFGLWHVLPSLGLASAKPALGGVFGGSGAGAALAVLSAVLFTAAAGVLFCELRRRSGSLLAPLGLHWAVNALGYLVGFLLR
ncbi:CPBP family intramembrane metalloprotease [Streptomyces globosus]|uniref:CPBP family intramembrane metalloprotease n=1 Tax=Streptomyces globosus TaxID=68209 RepID=A0A344U050_9ACTN|nr:CPBP family intramembrane metalloprotease [Streptomyces globosus]